MDENRNWPNEGWLGLKRSTNRQRRAEAIESELKDLQRTWTAVQGTRRRDAIYEYLTDVFAIVRRWTNRGRPKSLLRHTQAFAGQFENDKAELFSVLIGATTDADVKMVSKLSRVLRFCQRYNSESEDLGIFIKRRGGLNDCAALFTENLGSPRRKERGL